MCTWRRLLSTQGAVDPLQQIRHDRKDDRAGNGAFSVESRYTGRAGGRRELARTFSLAHSYLINP